MNNCVQKRSDTPDRKGFKTGVMAFVLGFIYLIMSAECKDAIGKRAYSDDSIDAYFSERTCWWNEVCKREFQVRFRCRCPKWSFCRSPGKYYDAYCSITRTGYIWIQQESDPDD